ncbi:thioredoxin-disulfide reductase [Brucella pseudogrignonensis]|uniref:thioredoxin-disulfide reductase n=1 Tax=Brucella pseudogrignonensis TaxID=419475 RepID=UPI001EDA72E7|nr:thioredoxin-disulfide reductase [Brucella pseudogrignonensis]UKK94703.1 thioredoxin-disulfide reductase [Brucella pseudogrignonensis]
MHSKLLILGAGPAGYTAGIYAARAMLNPLIVVTGLQPGGQLMITTEVENYPGFATPVLGPDLMETMAQQAINMGAIIRNDTIVRVDLSKRPFRLTGDSAEYTTDALIIATGAQAKWLGLPSEEMFHGRGVSACATCDAPFFRNKNVIVVGGGNTAVEEALFLANHAARVTLVHRRDSLRAEMVLQKRLFAHPKISVRWNSGVDEILGTRDPHEVTGVVLRDLIHETTETYPVDGVFVAIGHAPATTLFEGQLAMKPGGYLSTDPDSTATAIPGVFAAGDVTDDRFRQAVTAAGMGCMAALEAERFLHMALAA